MGDDDGGSVDPGAAYRVSVEVSEKLIVVVLLEEVLIVVVGGNGARGCLRCW